MCLILKLIGGFFYFYKILFLKSYIYVIIILIMIFNKIIFILNKIYDVILKYW